MIEMNFEKAVNLTPNTVRLIKDGRVLERFEPSGRVAEVRDDFNEVHSLSGKFDVYDIRIREVHNLPQFKNNQSDLYIVTRPVGFALAEKELHDEGGDLLGIGRPDVVIPDKMEYDTAGNPVGCQRFVRYWTPAEKL